MVFSAVRCLGEDLGLFLLGPGDSTSEFSYPPFSVVQEIFVGSFRSLQIGAGLLLLIESRSQIVVPILWTTVNRFQPNGFALSHPSQGI